MSGLVDTGGPAFPTNEGDDGMTLRDYFAAKAMSQIMNEWWDDREKNSTDVTFDSDASLMAENCYVMADAMLEARKS
jgi:hypothetical protein